MKLLKGKKIADRILQDLKKSIKKQKNKPGLAVVLVGENKASGVYVRLKKIAAGKIGIDFCLYKFTAGAREKDILALIKKLNINEKINGIIVQLPLPAKFNARKIISAIDPKKDADGFHPVNLKYFLACKPRAYPVFPKAIIKILEFSKVNLKNKKAVIIANSEIFGETMTAALKQKGISSRYFFHKNYKKGSSAVRQADILVTAVGKPGFIRGDMVKKSVIIIDGGITQKNKKVFGDVDRGSVFGKASFLTPVPGGVGPVTIACLLENVYLVSKKQA